MEIWDIYDASMQRTGETAIRDRDILGDGEYHLGVHVCLFNGDEMLIQRRAPEKEAWGGYWDVTAGGSAVRGETMAAAATRELFEEMGLYLRFTIPHFIIPTGNVLDCIFLEKIERLSPIPRREEVYDWRWASKDEIAEMICNDLFLPYEMDFLTLIFAMKERHGVLTNTKHKYGGKK